MIKNKYKVSKKQWNKWSEEGRKLFNDIYKFQKGVILPNGFKKLNNEEWKTVCWNFAFLAASMYPRKKVIDWDGRLWKVNNCIQDKVFLRRLSGWILDLSGNVNVSMRLKEVAEHTRSYCGLPGEPEEEDE